MFLTILIVLACIILLTAIFIISDSLRTGVVPMPSLPSERRLVSGVLQNYPEIKTIYDMGSGWGGLARHISRSRRDCRVIAVEASAFPHFTGRLKTRLTGRKTVSHRRQDLFEISLSGGEAYICYLSGESMKKLRKSFERDRPVGCILVSIAFAMPGWTPAKTVSAEGLLRTAAYVYEL